MLYICVGDDFHKRKHKADSLVHTLQNKRSDAALVTLESDHEHVRESLEQHISSLGLFDEKSIIKAQGILSDAALYRMFIDNLDAIVQSDNVFVFSEQQLSKKQIADCTAAGATVYEYPLAQAPSTAPNLFYLGDLLLQRKKSQLWIALEEELMRGVSIEELMGIIIWQAKSLHLATSHTQEKSGMKSFVYKKCLASQWSAPEAHTLHHQLVSIYHQSRRGGLTLTERLEHFILSI